jgi:hypothetical protein
MSRVSSRTIRERAAAMRTKKKDALDQVQRINDALILREQSTFVSNGVKYNQAYLYNQQKAIN